MLRLNEIFYSLQGESTQMGRPCIFIRLTGCKLRCTYCDTKYAYHEGSDATIEEILERIQAYPTRLVELTGGEPLEQKESIRLLERLAFTYLRTRWVDFRGQPCAEMVYALARSAHR